MKNPPDIVHNLSFAGVGRDEVVAAHPTVVAALMQHAMKLPASKLVVHVAPRFVLEPLEWALVITSPAGKSTHEVTQRTPSSLPLLDNKLF